VSANVQGFARSRSSKPGIYLFNDAGAGTVDQSIFIFSRRNGDERLIYLGAQVLPLGSALLELAAAARMKIDGKKPHSLRKIKESGSSHPFLDRARDEFTSALETETIRLLATVKLSKLSGSRQLSEIELIFGGGGHVENPYERGVRQSFLARIFNEPIRPRAIGLPHASDLELPPGITGELATRRLSVAYGLSFPRYEILPFILPDAVKPAERVWQKGEIPNAVTKDDC
jgi:hypothetical protein